MTCGSHAAPSCATTTAVTTCWGYVSFGDKGPFALRGLARGAGSVGGAVPAGPGYPLHNTRSDDPATARRSGRFRRPRGLGTPRRSAPAAVTSCARLARPCHRWLARQTPRYYCRTVSCPAKRPSRHDRRCSAPGQAARAVDCCRTARHARHRQPGRSDRLALQPAALALGQAAPDTEPLVMLQRVLQALRPDLAAPADPLGLPGGAALLRKERLRIGLRAKGPILPARLRGIILADRRTRRAPAGR